MPRSVSGTFTLVSGNPVTAATLIEASWANNTLNDIATALSDSLSRSGNGAMTAPLQLALGTAAAPSLTTATDLNTGLYLLGSDQLGLATGGTARLTIDAAGLVAVTGAATVGGTLGVTGAATLSSTLTVTGTTTLTGAATLTANPTLSAGTANGVLYLDGSKVATSGSALTFDGTTLKVGAGGTGAAAPQLTLDGGSAANGGGYIRFNRNGSTLTYVGSDSAVNGGSSDDFDIYASANIRFYALNTEGMRLTPTGLGIGTASLGNNRLHVVGNIGVNTGVTPGSNGAGIAIYASDFPRLTLRNSTTGDTTTDGLQMYLVGSDVSYNLQESGYQRWMNNNTEYMRLDASGNLGLGTSAFGTSAAGVLSIANGTAPTTGPADTVQIFSVDRSAGNTIPAIRCEGSGVTNAGITNTTVTNKIAISVNGTVYYLLATTNAT